MKRKRKASKPTAATVARIKEVAELRARKGMSWKEIAEKYDYSTGDTACSMMTGEYRAIWDEHFEHARKLWLNDIEHDAVQCQYDMMMDPKTDERVKQVCSHSLLNHTRQLRAQKIQIGGDPDAGPVSITLDFGNLENGNG